MVAGPQAIGTVDKILNFRNFAPRQFTRVYRRIFFLGGGREGGGCKVLATCDLEFPFCLHFAIEVPNTSCICIRNYKIFALIFRAHEHFMCTRKSSKFRAAVNNSSTRQDRGNDHLTWNYHNRFRFF